MTEQEIIQALIVAFPVGAVLVVLTWSITRQLPTIIDKSREYLAERNRGEKERAEILAQAQTEMVRAAAIMVDKSALAMKEYQTDSRVWWSGKVEELTKEIRSMEDRIHDLEEDNEAKNHRIEELERENGSLRREIEKLQSKADKRPAHKTAPRKKVA